MIWILPVDLTHWGRLTQKCLINLTTIVSDNGLSPVRHQAIIWTNGGIFLIWPLEINFDEISAKILKVSLNKADLRVSIATTGLIIIRNLDSNRQLFSLCDLEIWWMTTSTLHQALCIIWNPFVVSNWSYCLETLYSCQNRQFLVSRVTLKFDGWPWTK